MKSYPLLQSQLGVLIQSMQHPKSTQYNLPNYIFMPLSMTMERVASATRTLLQSFPELHTRFIVDEQGEVRQWCDMSMAIPVATRKCSETELQAYISDGFIRPFDLFGNEPLFRAEVIETEKSLCLLSDGHHAIVDGMSFAPILTSAFAKIFEGGSIEPQPYGMYQAAEDEAAAFGTPLYQRAKDYYAQKFAGTEMATLSRSPYGTMGAMGRYTTTVSRSACDDWCREHGVQANLLFQAAFSHVLSVLTRQQQVAYAALNHGRMDKRLRGSVGMFVKTVPLLANAEPSQRVVDFVKSQRGELMSSIRYGIYPFTHFCSDLGMKPGVTFNFQALADMEEHVMLSDGEMYAVQPVRKEIDSDLSVLIFLKGDSYEIRVESSLTMNDEATLQMVAEAIRVAVCNMIAHPELTLGELDIVSDEERDALIQLGTGEHLDIDPQMTFVKAFEQQARKTPDSLAVADATDSLTYGELAHRSDVLAHRLIACGVKPGDFVAVMLDRTIAFPLAVIAIHKAGAAYVPIDLEYPEERRKYMLDDSGAGIVVDDRFMTGTDFAAGASPVDLSSPGGLAYMIYTSGSTGKPKGAVLHQAGLWNLILSVIDAQELTGADRLAGHCSFSFDLHVADLFPILTLGGSFHVMPSAIRLDLDAIRRFLIDHQITGGNYTTSIAKMLLDKFGDLPLRFIGPAGEKLTSVHSDHMTIINGYGPTECCYTSFYRIAPGIRLGDVPIGRPVANCYYFIVDSRGRLLPRGTVGELCIAGIQVGNGYWHRPELTAEKFCDCPFVRENIDGTPVRMYHTGDLCRWNDDGEMEYIGRIDNQVKLRGYRIELGEIEACASRFEGISHVVAVVRPVSGNDTLCLYYTADAADPEALKGYLSENLPAYMVPTVFEQLDALPLTPNGKVDRKKLPEPRLQQEAIEAPATRLEQQLSDIVAEQLGTTAFGVTTDLVTIGLSSLGAMRLGMVIGQRTGLQIPVGDLLGTPTIRHMAEAAGQPRDTSGTDLTAFRRRQDHYPLTATQRGIHIDWELNRDTTQYNIPVAVCLGQTDPGLLADALRQVVQAHSYVKTRLAEHGGGIVQLRRDDAPVQVSVSTVDSEPDRDFFQQRVRPFNLFDDDLYRLEIYTCGGRTWLFRDFHHIVTDGLSDAVFFRDLLAALQGTQPREEQATAFDYALYEEQLMATDRYEEARHYFDALVSETEAASYPRSAGGTDHRSAHVQATVAGSESVREACRRMGITPNSYFQTVVAQVLHRLTRQERLMLATVSNGRSLAQTRDVMGLFIKTLPMVSAAFPNGVTFAEAARAMHRQSIESIGYDFYPLAETVERHGLHPEILYAFEEGIFDIVGPAVNSDADVIVPELDTQKMPIELIVYTDRNGAYVLHLGYDSAIYTQSSMTALANAITAYAAHAAEDGILLGDIELTTREERDALVALGTGRHLNIDTSKTYMDYFLQRAAACPDALAVADATGTLSYAQLDRYSDMLAQRLLACGVSPCDFVAVMTERTCEFPVSVFAIHKSGAAYLPLDSEYPSERLQYMLDDSGARVLITTHAVLSVRQSGDILSFNGRVIFLDDIDWEHESADCQPVNRCTPDGYTYIIYTSGSTGRPKGAVLHQKGLLSYVFSTIEELGLTSADRISSHRSFSFDSHIEDLYAILLLGGSLHVMPERIRKDLSAIRDFIVEHGVTGGGYTTSIAKMLVDGFDLPVRYVSAIGERLAGVVSKTFKIFNFYGPTECTDHISVHCLEQGRDYDNIPIGHVVANNWCFIVDTAGRLLPRGAVGELCIAGIQVGNGYWHRPELTAEKFCDCPFVTENIDGTPVRMYHTGDLCRWNDEGELEYIGRMDEQVKVRGYRIELGEVESCASRFGGIRQAVAVIRELSGSNALCLYYTAEEPDKTIDTDELRRFMGKTLADYMVPAAYTQLDALPLTPNGKVDRRRLPEPRLQQDAVEAPATELEQQLFDIAAEQLGTTAFGVTTDLVTIGLSSLGAMRLSMVIGQRTGLQIPVGDLLGTPTIRHMAEAAGQPRDTSGTDLTAFRRRQDHYPLTATQRGIHIDWELNRDTTQYNIPVAVCLGQTDPGLLADALRQVVQAHSYVKTRLAEHGGGIVQLRRDDAPVQVSVSTVDSEPDRDFFQQRVRPFNLFDDDLYRLEIYTCGGRTWLFRDFHHIVTDGLSDAVFFRDLLAALQGTQPREEQATAFDYALYEEQLMATDRYEEARHYFDALVSETEAASYPRSAGGTDHRSAHVQATVAGSESVREACRRMGITPNSYFQTVVAQVLHRLTRQERLMLATVSSGRSLAQTRDVMGLFIKTLPMVSAASPGGVTFADAARAMHRQSMESIGYDFYPLAETVERHGLRPEILYAFEEGIFTDTVIDPDTDVIVPELDTQKMPIELIVYTDRNGAYVLHLGYDSAFYTQSSMAALANAITAYAVHAAGDGILLGDIDMTTREERDALVALGTGRHLDIDPQTTFVKAFEQCASRVPENLAVADDKNSMTYGELSHASDVLAHRLIESGVRPGDFVAVMLDRTIAFPLAVIAIHKAGAAYVPIDLEYPEERRKYMLDDSGAGIVVDDRFMTGTDFAAGASPVDLSSPGGLAYMIYTSGSTGKPKGAVLHQAGLWNLILSVIDAQELTGADRLAGHCSFSFDLHVADLFPILTLGGSFHVMPSAIRLDLDAIRRFLIDHQITGGNYTTSIAKMLLDKFGDLPLRFIGPAGEKLTSVHSDHMTIINGYGPTECCYTSFYRIAPGIRLGDVPIGRPVANCYYFIVDSRGRLLPRGTVGELCIAGIQVGNGYWHRPELTAEKFCDCPFVRENIDGTPVRMYHTGDLCRWNDDGEMEYIGRIDNQVKLRGYRIELGEVESCASRFGGIRQAVAVIRELSGSNALCLYYTAEEPDKTIDTDELRRFMGKTLADYMVPAAYTQLDALPLTPNGKVDRRRLPEPSVTSTLEAVPPRTEKESVVLLIAQQVLGRDDFGITDDLFDLGLTSIAAIKVATMSGVYGIRISVNNLMRLRTIERLFAAETPVGYWFNAYNPEKPVLIVPHGIVPAISMSEKFQEWQDHFSIYTLEPTEEHATRFAPDNDYEKLVDAYAGYMYRDIPEDAHVFGFLGYSWGGEVSYSLATRWQQKRGGIPRVYLCDTPFSSPDTPKMTEEQITQGIIQYLMTHAADFDTGGLQTDGDGENGGVMGMALIKCGKDAGFAGEVLKIATKKFYSAEIYRRIQPLPAYDGHMTYFACTRENTHMEETLSKWEKLAPTMEVIHVDDNHMSFAIRNDNTYVVTERLLGDLQSESATTY